MDDAWQRRLRLLFGVAACCLCVSVTAGLVAEVTFCGENSKEKRREKRKREQDDRNIMANLFTFHAPPTQPIPYRDRYGELMEDPNREYVKHFTSMYSWELVDLVAILSVDISAARETSWRPVPSDREEEGSGKKRGRPVKYDVMNRLLFTLEFLKEGPTGKKQEFTNKWAKTSCHEDLKHVLRAINKNLKNEVRWPDAAERLESREKHGGIFRRVVGIMDGQEHRFKKPGDSEKERRTYSKKKGSNTRTTLFVSDFRGLFIYVGPTQDGARNDRQVYTSAPLFLNAVSDPRRPSPTPKKYNPPISLLDASPLFPPPSVLTQGAYFSDDEVLAADGAFAGTGPVIVSYDVLDTEAKKNFNATFTEVRKEIENSIGRVQLWFPILGAKKKYWPYDEELLVSDCTDSPRITSVQGNHFQ